jgi:hypothetical protein
MANGEETRTPSQHELARIAIRVPPFWDIAPEMWFAQLEAQFATAGITTELTKYNIVIGQVDAKLLMSISDIVRRPPTNNQYSTLRRIILERHTDSEQTRIKKLTSAFDAGDLKPTELLRQMQTLAGDLYEEKLVKILWMQKLPQHVQTIVTTRADEPVDKLAILADRISEVMQPEMAAIRASSSHASTPHASNSNAHPSESQAMSKEIKELRQQINGLISTVNQLSRNHERPKQGRNYERSQSTDRHCYYHQRFGKAAKQCREPCTYAQDTKNE